MSDNQNKFISIIKANKISMYIIQHIELTFNQNSIALLVTPSALAESKLSKLLQDYKIKFIVRHPSDGDFFEIN